MAQKILGIDPGLTRCGFGLVSSDRGRIVKFLEVGVLQSQPKDEISDRLLEIANQIESLLDRAKPDVVAIERIFSQQNLKTVVSIANISGVIAYLARKRGIQVEFFTPTQVKAAVTGSGRANKAQIGVMVSKILKVANPSKIADANDALAIAITAAWQTNVASSDRPETSATLKWRAAENAAKKSQR